MKSRQMFLTNFIWNLNSLLRFSKKIYAGVSEKSNGYTAANKFDRRFELAGDICLIVPALRFDSTVR